AKGALPCAGQRLLRRPNGWRPARRFSNLAPITGEERMRPDDRRVLGKAGVEVTVMGFGGAPLGNMYQAFSDAQARATLEACWDAGIRYFDTAPLYGFGLSEHRLGEALRGRSRGEFVLSTRSEEHTSELQSRENLVCRLL